MSDDGPSRKIHKTALRVMFCVKNISLCVSAHRFCFGNTLVHGSVSLSTAIDRDENCKTFLQLFIFKLPIPKTRHRQNCLYFGSQHVDYKPLQKPQTSIRNASSILFWGRGLAAGRRRPGCSAGSLDVLCARFTIANIGNHNIWHDGIYVECLCRWYCNRTYANS